MDKNPTQTGVLLVNLGTPNSPLPADVKRYLIEFLTDPHVIDTPWLWRQILVRSFIVPNRYKQSAASYAAIWTPQGSPLYVYGCRVKQELQNLLGHNFFVELSMRYGNPSIAEGLTKLLKKPLDSLIVLPLFPQFASATTGSIYVSVIDFLKRRPILPRLTFIDQFAAHPSFINALSQQAKKYPLGTYDHILFSYHGLPERHIKKANLYGCLQSDQCCQNISTQNKGCYSAQCYATTNALAKTLGLSSEAYSICFQSRLGKDSWLQPYASDTIKALAKKGKKKILVFCPSFVCDCLETLYEIGVEYAQEFKHHGGNSCILPKH